MQRIYHAESLIDAEMARAALEDAGIPAFVDGQYLLGGIGELPVGGLLSVMVPQAAVEAARLVLIEAGIIDPPQDAQFL